MAAVYTTSNGRPISNPEASDRIGSNGPLLLQDFHLIDLLAHFDRERIPERVVHAKGAGAYGEFEVTHDITDIVSLSNCLNPLSLSRPHTNAPTDISDPLLPNRQKDTPRYAFLHRRRREGFRRQRAGPSRLLYKILHRRREPGSCNEQYPYFLHSRSCVISAFHSYAEEESTDKSQGCNYVLGLPLHSPRVHTSGLSSNP